jgi:hypothetical protein
VDDVSQRGRGGEVPAQVITVAGLDEQQAEKGKAGRLRGPALAVRARATVFSI